MCVSSNLIGSVLYGSCRIRTMASIMCGDLQILISTGQVYIVRPRKNNKSALGHRVTTCGPIHNVHLLLWMFDATLHVASIKGRVPSDHDLPLELALLVLKYAAESTFSQKEKYAEKNPYADAISLCRVSRLVRRTVLPELLHTVSLRRCYA
ncbi:hypothetical protein BDR07DRAFT_410761 [Suillus spraguei]|nr:hypothetical protein BDR07DRAFT_410761 [Suillus spraguei]